MEDHNVALRASSFCITALPQFFWMKDRPAEMGLKIEEGLKPKQLKKKKRITNEPADEPEDWDVKSALKTPQIWILEFCMDSSVRHLL